MSSPEEIQAETARRYAIWQRLEAICPSLIQTVCNLARTQGVSEKTLRWWLQEEPTHTCVAVGEYTVQLNFNRTLELVTHESVHNRLEQDSMYGGWPFLTNNAVLEFGGNAIQELTVDLLTNLEDPHHPK